MSYEQLAHDYLSQVQERRGWPGAVAREDVQQLAALLERVVAEERRACAEIVDDTVKLFGSHTAEHAARLIRGRGQGESA